jgi:prepilin-type N-terminal cleavage/methylation domain-containing protein
MKVPHRDNARGFTLVEVLLTLLIIGGILVTMTQILNAARRSRDTIHNIQETQLAGPAILDMIERDLRGLVVFATHPQNHLRVKDRILLGLDGDSIDFVTATDGLVPVEGPDEFLRADVNEVGYRLRPSRDNDDFLEMYRRESFGVDATPFDEGNFTFLHDRVKGFDVAIFVEDGPEAEPLTEWGADSRNTEYTGLPVRLEISLVLELAPRIAREQLLILPQERRIWEYKRVIRLPEKLRFDNEADVPVLAVPGPPSGGASGGEEQGGTSQSGGGGSTSGRDQGEGQEQGQSGGGGRRQ